VKAITSVDIARIISTHVIIVAVFRAATRTSSFGTNVIYCAGVTVRTRSVVGSMCTDSRISIARIIGTNVAIVTICKIASFTNTIVAHVVAGAGILIGARCVVISIYTLASIAIARIVGTHIFIIAIFRTSRCASSSVTSVVQCTFITIRARSLVIGKYTSTCGTITGIIGTQVIVIAFFRFAGDTLSVVALVGTRAGVTIGAGKIIILV
jgi:hypothetical protein